jgi:hypothetical protein
MIINILLTSTSIIAMGDPYAHMIHNIANASKENPCITLINNSPKQLYIRIGDLEIDGIRSLMPLQSNSKFTFSPYAHPFFLDKKQIQKGTTVTFFPGHPENNKEDNTKSLSVSIGGNSKIQFGDTLQIMYEKNVLAVDNIPAHDFDYLRLTKKTPKTLKVPNKNPKRSLSVS